MLARELGQVPLVAWAVMRRHAGLAELRPIGSNHLGKAATTLQFGALVAAVLRVHWLESMLWACGVGGMMAVLGYWALEVRGSRAATFR